MIITGVRKQRTSEETEGLNRECGNRHDADIRVNKLRRCSEIWENRFLRRFAVNTIVHRDNGVRKSVVQYMYVRKTILREILAKIQCETAA